MNFNPKAAFIDLDGTLLDKGFWHYARPSKENIDVIRKIGKQFPIVLSTGRSADKQIIHLLKILDLKYAVCQNGSLIIDYQSNILKNIKLDNDTVRIIAQKTVEAKLTFSINSTGEIYGNKWKTWWISRFSNLKPKPFSVAKLPKTGVNKILIIGFSKREVRNFAKQLEIDHPECSIKVVGRNWAIEVTDKSATKGLGNSFIAKEYLKIDPRETLHIGDSMNDSSVIGHMGKLIAMGNSYKDFKKIADEVGPNKKRGGVAKILLKEFQT